MVSALNIAGRPVGPGHPCFVIAEAGVNHNGDVAMAHRLIDIAVAAGADAVKFQTFSAKRLVTAAAAKASYQKVDGDDGETQAQMLARLELDEAAHRALIAHCAEAGIVFLSSPFDEEAADMLDDLGVPAFKVASGELTNHPFLRHLAAKGRAMIMSTGMAAMDEVAQAVAVVRGAGAVAPGLLHCVSAYPARPADCNLRAIAAMAAAFDVVAGWSDHTPGTTVSLAAVALGASIVEKHFTIDRGLPGPDHKASLEPDELAAMVADIRTVEACLGDGIKRPTAAEAEIAAVARKSLVATRDLEVGAILGPGDVAARRPGTGIAPGQLEKLLGRQLKQGVAAETVLGWEMFEDPGP